MTVLSIYRQSRPVYRYVFTKAVHNSLPLFALVLIAIHIGPDWLPLAVIGTQIFTSMTTDLTFFAGLKHEVKNGDAR